MEKLRWAGSALFLLLVVLVDFTSSLMSVITDAVLVCCAIVLLWPLIKKGGDS